ncbi:hypothetical protein N7465_012013 [Penicillium sp. CMV-2018d]|nr:hypothetical protein N7465_012013 [Penicillium sp. CMV-2018d]
MAITGYFVDIDWVYHEILLGFMPVHGQHTSAYLAEVLLGVLSDHGIVDRIDLPDSTEIIRVPCLTHVIQLSLKDLLGLIKANPKNDKTVTQAKLQKGIIYTLVKVRAFAVFINASPQRWEAFLNL